MKVSGGQSDQSSEHEDYIERQIAEHILQHDSSVADKPTVTASDHPEMLGLSMPKIVTEEVDVPQQMPLNLTVTCKCDAPDAGLVFVDSQSNTKSSNDSIEVFPVITLSKPLPPDSLKVTSHPVPILPNEVTDTLPNVHVDVIVDFKQKVPTNLMHGPNITCCPLDISSDWEPVETFDNITDVVPEPVTVSPVTVMTEKEIVPVTPQNAPVCGCGCGRGRETGPRSGHGHGHGCKRYVTPWMRA